MIDKKIYDLDYIRELQARYKTDPGLLERVLYAFGLLQALVKVGMKFTFKGGIHPLHDRHEGKAATSGKPVRPFVSDTVCIAMDMHLGAPSKPCVKKGDRVLMGQVIGEPVTAGDTILYPMRAELSTVLGTCRRLLCYKLCDKAAAGI